MSRFNDREDAALFGALSELGDEPLPGEASDADIVAGALAGLQAPAFLVDEAAASTAAPIADPEGPSRGIVVAIVAAMGFAAAAALVLLIGAPRYQEWREHTRDPGSLAPAVHEGDATVREANERTPPEKPRARPAATLDDATTEEDTTGGPEEIDATGGIPVDHSETVPRRHVAPLPKSADALLSHAQELLRDGKTTAAMRAYKQLVDRFGRSREAKAALVSMGRIELQRGRAKQALSHFDAYLAASAGPLVEEARYGRIRALRKLGRTTQERQSIEAFLADHARSIYAPRLRKRAEELRGE
jgi:tetratricopeptide (TPR) repeat protein